MGEDVAHARRADLHRRAAVHDGGHPGRAVRRRPAHARRGQRPSRRREAQARRPPQATEVVALALADLLTPSLIAVTTARATRACGGASARSASRRSSRGARCSTRSRCSAARCAPTPASDDLGCSAASPRACSCPGIVSPLVGRADRRARRPPRARGGLAAGCARVVPCSPRRKGRSRCSPDGCLPASRWRRACTIPPSPRCTRSRAASYRRAVTALTLFGGFASTVFWPLSQYLLDTVGWRDDVRRLRGAAPARVPAAASARCVPPSAMPHAAAAGSGRMPLLRRPRDRCRLRLARDGAVARRVHRLGDRGAPHRPAHGHGT